MTGRLVDPFLRELRVSIQVDLVASSVHAPEIRSRRLLERETLDAPESDVLGHQPQLIARVEVNMAPLLVRLALCPR